MKKLISTILMLAVVIVLPVNATNYYVSSTRSGRSDSNAGTSSNAPWATMGRVVSQLNSLRAGDTVYLERGSVFTVNTSAGSDSENYLKLQAGGTSGNPVTITGAGYGTGNKPIIRRTGGSGPNTFVMIRDSYIVVRDIEFDGNMAAGFSTGGISFWADGTYDGDNGVINGVQILNNYIHNLGGTSSGDSRYICGIILNSSDSCSVQGALIEGNTVSDYSAHGLNHYPGNHNNNIWRNNRVINSYTTRDSTVNSALQAGTGSGNIYENNYLNDTTLTSDGAAIRIAGKISAGGLNTIRNNVIVGSGYHGIWFVQSNEAGSWLMRYDIYGNIVYNCSRAGFIVQPGGSWASGSYLNVYNNTFYRNWVSGGTTSDGEITIGDGCNNTTINLRNNLIHHPDSSSSVCLYVNPNHNASIAHNNNLYYRTGTASKAAINDRGTQYTLANVGSYESTAQKTDPLFVSTANLPTSVSYASGATPNGLSVQASSPAVGKGANLGSTYALDINRAARTVPWTIGAYQFGGAVPPSDTTLPTVSITTPSGGALVSGSAVTLSASASDNVGVTGVQFKLAGADLEAEDTASPYSISWNTTGAANGLNSLTAVARDAAGNMRTSAVVTVTVSNAAPVAPTVSITSPVSGAVVSGTAAISASASAAAGVAGVQFRLDEFNLGAEDTAAPYSITWYTLADEGVQNLKAVARDTAGNIVTSAVITVTVDNAAPTAPTVSITALTDGAVVSGTAVTVSASASASAGVAGVQFKLDGANLGTEDTTSPYSTSWNTTGVLNGLHSLAAVVRDTAGSITTSAVIGVTVNNIVTTAPTVSITSPVNGSVVSGTTTISADASSDAGVAGVQFRLDEFNLGAEDTAAPYSITWYTLADEGVQNLKAVARDTAGNIVTSAVVTVTVNNAAPTAPTVSISAPTNGAAVSGTAVAVSASASASAGMAGVQFKLDGANLGTEDTTSPYSISWNTTGVPNGSHPLTAVARDAAGSSTTSAVISVTVNNAAPAPTVSISAPANGAAVSGAAVTVSASASSAAGVQFKLDGTNLGTEDTTSPYSAVWNTTTASSGAHSLTAVARNTAGSTATSAVISVTVSNALADTTPPTVSVSAPASGAVVFGNAMTVSAGASDNTGVTGVQFKLDGANLGTEDVASPYSVFWNTTTASSGSHGITAVARDAAGNIKTSAVVTVTVSNALPAGALISTTAWQNQSFASQSGQFSAEFDAVPASATIDAITGLSRGNATALDNLAVMVRFNPGGQIDAQNGNVYAAVTPVSYTAGTNYHFRLVVNLTTHVYSGYVKAGNGSEILIASNYVFRTSQNTITNLNTLAITAVTGNHRVSGFVATPIVVEPTIVIPEPPSGLRVVP